MVTKPLMGMMFQHTAARRRLVVASEPEPAQQQFQHTAARRRLAGGVVGSIWSSMFQHTAARRRLANNSFCSFIAIVFQHTAARRRLVTIRRSPGYTDIVSTHSRPKAAGRINLIDIGSGQSFNTQPPEGGWDGRAQIRIRNVVSTHSRPKAAGSDSSCTPLPKTLFQHTAARRRLAMFPIDDAPTPKFQHTAARRRLGPA